MKIQAVRGMNDIMGAEIRLWHGLEAVIRRVYENFGYTEIRTPILEQTQLFKRGVGNDTDIVEKEMYSFEDRSGDHLSMRPEGTASVVRALNEHAWLNDHPVTKFYYIAPMFRHERPQKGRLRQFHQYGVELVGVQDPESDAEVIAAHEMLYKELGVDARELRLSSVGCKNCRPPYKEKLSALLLAVKDQIPEDFHKRIMTNPQRIFDHKNPTVQELTQNLPVLLDELCEDCRSHLDGVKRGLDRLSVSYVIDPKIVRGLDYYNRTAFEFTSSMLGAQSAIGGGGRYDNLIEELGGKATPAVGFAGGLERLALLLESEKPASDEIVDVVVVYADDIGREKSYSLANELRQNDFRTEVDLQNRKMKNQMARADKLQAQACLILGARELESNSVVLKNMVLKTQETVALADVVNRLKDLIKRS